MRFGPALLLSTLLPLTASAAGKGETAVAGGPGLAVLFDGQTRLGGSGDVRLLRGLSDSWSAKLALGFAWIPSTSHTPTTRLLTPSLGLVVAADAVNLVPFAELGVVFADVRGDGTAARQRLGGALALGADYLLSRHLALSLLGRVDYLALRLAGAGASRPVLLVLTLSLGYVF
jgi:hypothetical protein